MAEYFGHERLKVYQKGMPFASMRKTLLDDLSRRVAACSDNSQRRSGMTSEPLAKPLRGVCKREVRSQNTGVRI
jgi:hypothetical protein